MGSEPRAKAKETVEIWTDGGCRPNPGPGGWGVILRFRGAERELSGGEAATTNNRMELTAAAEALEALTRPAAWCCTRIVNTCEMVSRVGTLGGYAGTGVMRPAIRWPIWICGGVCSTRPRGTKSNGVGYGVM